MQLVDPDFGFRSIQKRTCQQPRSLGMIPNIRYRAVLTDLRVQLGNADHEYGSSGFSSISDRYLGTTIGY